MFSVYVCPDLGQLTAPSRVLPKRDINSANNIIHFSAISYDTTDTQESLEIQT